MNPQNTPQAKKPVSLLPVPPQLQQPFATTRGASPSEFGRLLQNIQRFTALGLALCGLSLGVFSLYAQASLSPQHPHGKSGIDHKWVAKTAPKLPPGITPVWLPGPNAPDPDGDLSAGMPDDQLISPPPSIAPVNATNPEEESSSSSEAIAMLGAQTTPSHAGHALQSLKTRASRTTTLTSTEDEDEGLLWQQVLTPGLHPHTAAPHTTSRFSSYSKIEGLRKSSFQRFSRNIGQGLRCFLMPVQRVLISSPFGPRHGRLHAGIDFAASVGDPIHASAGGRVLYANWGGGYGRMVIVDHGNGLMTRYAHCSRLMVMPGQWVTKAQTIALVGDTGHSTGPHLHYEVLANGIPQNPSGYLIR